MKFYRYGNKIGNFKNVDNIEVIVGDGNIAKLVLYRLSDKNLRINMKCVKSWSKQKNKQEITDFATLFFNHNQNKANNIIDLNECVKSWNIAVELLEQCEKDIREENEIKETDELIKDKVVKFLFNELAMEEE